MVKKADNFLKLPEYPGGREQFKEFIRTNLRYPQKALENKVEGFVIVSADITDRGEVENIKIEKGIGSGCDEEAMRVVGLMKFGSVKNRGLRVKSHRTFKINFKLPRNKVNSIQYSVKKEESPEPKKVPVSYTYSINITQPE
jgi:TonB family protein